MFSRHNLSIRFYVSFAQSVFLIMHIYEQYIWFNHIFTIISSNCLVFLRYRCRLYKIMHGRQRSKKGGETCGNTGNGLTSFPVFSLFSPCFSKSGYLLVTTAGYSVLITSNFNAAMKGVKSHAEKCDLRIPAWLRCSAVSRFLLPFCRGWTVSLLLPLPPLSSPVFCRREEFSRTQRTPRLALKPVTHNLRGRPTQENSPEALSTGKVGTPNARRTYERIPGADDRMCGCFFRCFELHPASLSNNSLWKRRIQSSVHIRNGKMIKLPNESCFCRCNMLSMPPSSRKILPLYGEMWEVMQAIMRCSMFFNIDLISLLTRTRYSASTKTVHLSLIISHYQ